MTSHYLPFPFIKLFGTVKLQKRATFTSRNKNNLEDFLKSFITYVQKSTRKSLDDRQFLQQNWILTVSIETTICRNSVSLRDKRRKKIWSYRTSTRKRISTDSFKSLFPRRQFFCKIECSVFIYRDRFMWTRGKKRKKLESSINWFIKY